MLQGGGSVSVVGPKDKLRSALTLFWSHQLQWMLWFHSSQDGTHGVEKCGVSKEVTLLLQIILMGPEHSLHVSSCFLEKAFLKCIL